MWVQQDEVLLPQGKGRGQAWRVLAAESLVVTTG